MDSAEETFAAEKCTCNPEFPMVSEQSFGPFNRPAPEIFCIVGVIMCGQENVVNSVSKEKRTPFGTGCKKYL